MIRQPILLCMKLCDLQRQLSGYQIIQQVVVLCQQYPPINPLGDRILGLPGYVGVND